MGLEVKICLPVRPLGQILQIQGEHHQVSAHSWSSINKDCWKEWSFNRREKRTSTLKLETSSAIYAIQHDISLHIYIYDICINSYIMWYVYVDIHIYIYIPTKGSNKHRFKQWQISTGQKFRTKHPRVPPAHWPIKSWASVPWNTAWSMTAFPKLMGLWNIPENNWVV